MSENKRFSHVQIMFATKVSFCILALIIAYLFALNGRYIKQDRDEYFDKWTKTVILADYME